MSETSSVEGLRFVTAHPADIAAHDRWNEVQTLREEFYEAALAGRSRQEIATFVTSTTHSAWDDPNNSTLLGGFARPRVVVAFGDDDELRGFAYGANNASSHRPGIVGQAEIFSKLYLPSYSTQESRYVLLREVVGENDVVMGAMTALLLKSYKGHQPVKSYPYVEETGLLRRNRAMGLRTLESRDNARTPLPPEPIEAFGPKTEPAMQLTQQASTVKRVLNALRSTYPEALAQAEANHRRDYGGSAHFPVSFVD